MKVFACILYMVVASANCGNPLAGGTPKEGFDFDADFGKDSWLAVGQESDIGDYGAVLGSGKPITEVLQEEGAGIQGDYGKYTEFTEDAGYLASEDNGGWYGISGVNSGFSEHNQAEKVVHEEVGTEGLGSFRTIQSQVGHNEYVHHVGLAGFSEQQEIKTIKDISEKEEDGSDTFGPHGYLGEFGVSSFDNYEAGGGYNFGFDQFGEDHFEEELKDIHDEDYSHGYHENGGLNTANGGFDHTAFAGYESGFDTFKSGDSQLDVA